jgi:hypothetical protein
VQAAPHVRPATTSLAACQRGSTWLLEPACPKHNLGWLAAQLTNVSTAPHCRGRATLQAPRPTDPPPRPTDSHATAALSAASADKRGTRRARGNLSTLWAHVGDAVEEVAHVTALLLLGRGRGRGRGHLLRRGAGVTLGELVARVALPRARQSVSNDCGFKQVGQRRWPALRCARGLRVRGPASCRQRGRPYRMAILLMLLRARQLGPVRCA